MTNTITEQRIINAKKAHAAAQNPDFKEYWRKVADTLAKHIDD
jgi:hypothetical protein